MCFRTKDIAPKNGMLEPLRLKDSKRCLHSIFRKTRASNRCVSRKAFFEAAREVLLSRADTPMVSKDTMGSELRAKANGTYRSELFGAALDNSLSLDLSRSASFPLTPLVRRLPSLLLDDMYLRAVS